MSFTYTASPTTSNRDAVRLELGDTDSADPLLYDEEITYLLGQQGTVARAALEGCRLILARLGRRVTVSIDGVSKSLSEQFTHYKELLPLLEERATQIVGAGALFAGGLTVSGKDAVEADSDRVRPAFTRERFGLVGAEDDDGAAD